MNPDDSLGPANPPVVVWSGTKVSPWYEFKNPNYELNINLRVYFTLPDLQGIYPFPPGTDSHYDVVTQGPGRGPAASPSSPLRNSVTSQPLPSNSVMRTYIPAPVSRIPNLLILCQCAHPPRGTRAMSDSFMNAIHDPTKDDGTLFAHLARKFPSSPPQTLTAQVFDR